MVECHPDKHDKSHNRVIFLQLDRRRCIRGALPASPAWPSCSRQDSQQSGAAAEAREAFSSLLGSIHEKDALIVIEKCRNSAEKKNEKKNRKSCRLFGLLRGYARSNVALGQPDCGSTSLGKAAGVGSRGLCEYLG